MPANQPTFTNTQEIHLFLEGGDEIFQKFWEMESEQPAEAPDCEHCGTPSDELEHLEEEGNYYCPTCGCRTPDDVNDYLPW